MDNDDGFVGRVLSRREIIAIVGAGGIAAFLGCGGGGVGSSSSGTTGSTSTSTGTTTATTASTATTTGATTGTTAGGNVGCVLVSPELTEGPYFVDELLNRSDIRTDTDTGTARPGLPLEIVINLVNVGSICTSIVGAMVDIWHCDAGGLYSDVSQNGTVGLNFLRGYQTSDSSGQVVFTTIYPGWYSGRAVHIHFKVRVGNHEFTSQLFFDETVNTAVHSQSPYSSHGQRDTLNANDNIYQQGGNMLMPSLAQTASGYRGTISIGMVL